MVRYLLIVSLLLAGCTVTPEPFIAGHMVDSPAGWVDYCLRYPLDVSCSQVTE
jgi:hypothetical protein